MEEYRNDAKNASEDNEILGLYNRALDEERIRLNEIKRKTDEARDEGIKQGIEQGIEQGALEKQKEVVKNMLKENVSDELIIKTTNISFEELDKIKEE